MAMNALKTSLCAAALLAVSGCGAENPLIETHPYDGNWVGTLPESSRRVRFTILLSRITYFEADIRFPNCWTSVSAQPYVQVSGKEFAFNVGGSLVSSILVTGTIESERRLTGTLGSGTLRGSFCGALPGFATQAETFTAEQ